jgi:chorismate synthase
MPGNTFGRYLRITTFGESHGEAVGVIIDGMPAGFTVSLPEIQKQMDRRKPGQSDITTPRKEADEISILSGVFENMSTQPRWGLRVSP